MTRKKTHREFVAKLSQVNPDIEVLGQYVNSGERITVRCRLCGHMWEPIARNLVNAGQGCPICRHKQAHINKRKTKAKFVEEMRSVNPSIIVIGKYVTSKQKIECRCLVCGNTWSAKPANLKSGYGCPRCARTGTSFMEQFICVALETLLGPDEVKSRDRSAIGKELDIWIPSKSIAIEAGSRFWHRGRLKSDAEKERLCHQNNIELTTIYDCCPDVLPDSRPTSAMTFTFSLAEERDHTTLKKIVSIMASKNGLGKTGQLDWSKIEKEAAFRNSPKRTEEFVKQVSKVRPDVEVLGNYLGSRSKVRCRCRECGNEWQTTPHQLLRGQGCPACGHKKAAMAGTESVRVSPKEYRKSFERNNPALELLSEYTGSLQRVKVKCKECGHICPPPPSQLYTH